MQHTIRRVDWPVFLLVLVSVAYRLFLSSQYYGWEESDYGNLAMARGVLESGFREYDMRHLPFYYLLSALVLVIVKDTVVATHAVSLVSGCLSVLFGYFIARRLFGEWTARVTGLLLCFQPEFALYSASSLREPLYACLTLGGCLALLRGRFKLSSVATGFSFLTRFDAMGTNMPATLIHLARRPPGLANPRHPVWITLSIFLGVVVTWSIYCGRYHGNYIFFLPTVEVNIDTGGAQEISDRIEFIRQGFFVVLSLAFRTLPNHLGSVVWGTALLGLFMHRRDLLARTAIGTLFVYFVLNTALWLAIGFVAQHEHEHNLYWKWMYVLVPFWCMFSADALVRILRRFEKWPGAFAWAALLSIISISVPFYLQTKGQLDQSRRLYRPQVELARWIEDRVPPETTLIFDNIPACYINRKPHQWRFISWFDVPVTDGDALAFVEYVRDEHVAYVLWFKEEWTQAPSVAPFLATLDTHTVNGIRFVPMFDEPEYGFIFYEVVEDVDR